MSVIPSAGAHMRATRLAYLTILLATAALNGAALAQLLGAATILDGLPVAAVLFNLVFIPILGFVAYRLGQLSEEHYREEKGEA